MAELQLAANFAHSKQKIYSVLAQGCKTVKNNFAVTGRNIKWSPEFHFWGTEHLVCVWISFRVAHFWAAFTLLKAETQTAAVTNLCSENQQCLLNGALCDLAYYR